MDPTGKILLIRLKSLGDIVLTLPAVHELRTAFPTGQFTFLVSKELAPVLEGFGEVDAVLPLDRSSFRGFKPKAALSEGLSLLRALRGNRFSLAVDFQGYGETAWLTWWSGAPQRWGIVNRPARKWAYTRRVPRDASLHPAKCNLALVKPAGVPTDATGTEPPSVMEDVPNWSARDD